MGIFLREERVADYKKVEQLVKRAFLHAPTRSGTEHRIVEQLRKEPTFNSTYALVAVDDETIVGHVMLSQATIIHGDKKRAILSLSAVSVAPERQRQGIGKKMIDHVLAIATREGEEAVIVLGHPTYYPKFGFKRASLWGIKLPFDAPDNAFLALELAPSGLENKSGIVEYSTAFFGE